ncbi:unnamed protein product [Lathyrus sativus]|nr:unnamed protein product [Lathyrus sativus]
MKGNLLKLYECQNCRLIMSYIRRKLADEQFALTHVDEVIDELLTTDYSCDIAMPRIKKRWTLESLGSLEPRQSALKEDWEPKRKKEKKEKKEKKDDGTDHPDPEIAEANRIRASLGLKPLRM